MSIDLVKIARDIMLEKGLVPDFSDQELQQLSNISNPAALSSDNKDLRSLLWCSIDNDTSLDLDQLTYAEKGPDNKVNILIAIADVDAIVAKGSAIDQHAQINTTSVYTPAKIFPMLPEKLSTNLTSLNENEDRVAMVVSIQISQVGDLESTSIFLANVRNYAKLTYNEIGGWLEGKLPLPDSVKRVDGLQENLQMQHEIAQILKKKRHTLGSLTLESSDAEVKIENGEKIIVEIPAHNFAHQLIEEFMVAANTSVANHFNEVKIASLRRVVRIPKNWDRIVEIAKEYGYNLPVEPDSKALDDFLVKRKQENAELFPDLSLTIIKLLGRGEYIVENNAEAPVGHFALALPNYTHSTAPNRRYPDLISQRQFKAHLRLVQPPYTIEELQILAAHCTKQEDAAVKVERQVNKSAAAMGLSSQIGSVYKGVITGASTKGTWVRILEPAVEGKIVQGFQNVNVGDKVLVRLKYVDVAKGFIDFEVVKNN